MNRLTEEPINVIEAAGLTLDPNDNTQLLQAIGVLAARKNQVINGQFQNWRARPNPLPAGTTGSVYGPDQWRIQSAGKTFTAATGGFAIGHTIVGGDPRRYLGVTPAGGAGAGGEYVRVTQPIEDCTRFSARQITVAFDARAAAGAPYLGFCAEQNFGSEGSAAVPGLGPQRFTLSTDWQRFQRTFTLPSVAGKSFGSGLTSKTYLDLQWYMAAGADWNSLVGGAVGHQTTEIMITNVRMVIGPSASPIDLRDEWSDGLLSLRYFEVGGSATTANGSFVSGGGIGVQAVGASAITIIPTVRYQVQKRAAPTLTLINPIGDNNQIRNLTRNADCTESGLYVPAGINGFVAQCRTTTGSAAGDINGFHWIADARY